LAETARLSVESFAALETSSEALYIAATRPREASARVSSRWSQCCGRSAATRWSRNPGPRSAWWCPRSLCQPPRVSV